MSVTFTDSSTGPITSRFWDFGDGTTTNTTQTLVTHLFTATGTDTVTLIVGDGLTASTNALNIVVTAQPSPPVFKSINVSGTNLIVSGTGGTISGNYFVLASTNLAPALSNWMVIATNQFDSAGGFRFTNPASGGAGQNFFRLQLP